MLRSPPAAVRLRAPPVRGCVRADAPHPSAAVQARHVLYPDGGAVQAHEARPSGHERLRQVRRRLRLFNSVNSGIRFSNLPLIETIKEDLFPSALQGVLCANERHGPRSPPAPSGMARVPPLQL